MIHARRLGVLLVFWIAWPCTFATAGEDEKDTAATLRALDGNVWPREGEKSRDLGRMLARDVRARIQTANQRETADWKQVKDRGDWERYRDTRLEALRASLGQFPPTPKDLKVRVTRTLDGEGYRIENLVFESRPGLY